MLSLLVIALLASSAPNQITGVVGPKCAVLDEVRLCSQDAEDGYTVLNLTVSGRASSVLDGVRYDGDHAPDYKIERVSGAHYRITIGERGLADAPFFYFTEVDFEARANAGFLVVRYSVAGEHRCESDTPLDYVGTVDFAAGT